MKEEAKPCTELYNPASIRPFTQNLQCSFTGSHPLLQQGHLTNTYSWFIAATTFSQIFHILHTFIMNFAMSNI